MGTVPSWEVRPVPRVDTDDFEVKRTAPLVCDYFDMSNEGWGTQADSQRNASTPSVCQAGIDTTHLPRHLPWHYRTCTVSEGDARNIEAIY